jgi:hypothetical protein
MPSSNLISNIGFGPDATHTFDSSSALSKIAATDMNFPLVHPKHVSITSVDEEIDKLFFNTSLFELKVGFLFSKAPKWVRAILVMVRKWSRGLFSRR